tara:strand:- start:379 stop:537 length:159 start_codon:yes stop_codon:yes gene_type:complete
MKTYLVTLEEKTQTLWEVEAKTKEDAENNFYYGNEKMKTFVTQEVTEVKRRK